MNSRNIDYQTYWCLFFIEIYSPNFWHLLYWCYLLKSILKFLFIVSSNTYFFQPKFKMARCFSIISSRTSSVLIFIILWTENSQKYQSFFCKKMESSKNFKINTLKHQNSLELFLKKSPPTFKTVLCHNKEEMFPLVQPVFSLTSPKLHPLELFHFSRTSFFWTKITVWY